MKHLSPLKLWDHVRSVSMGRTLFVHSGSRYIDIATHYLDPTIGCFPLTTLDMTAYNDPEGLFRDINMIAYNHKGRGLGFGFPAGEKYQDDPLAGFSVKDMINRLRNSGCRLPFTVVNEDLTTRKADDKLKEEYLNKNPRTINMHAAVQIGKVFIARVNEDQYLRKVRNLNYDYE